MDTAAKAAREPSLWKKVYRSVIKPIVKWGALGGITLGPWAVGENTAIAEQIKHFPFPTKLGTEIETEYQPVSGSDHSRFSIALFGIGEGGKPEYGDVARFFFDRYPDGTAKKQAGARIPFNFEGSEGKLTLYGLEHDNDEGLGARLRALYNDWVFSGVIEGAEFEGVDKDLKGLGIGKIFHSDLGETTIELWGYDKIGEMIGNLFLFQRFQDGYLGGVSFTGGNKEERDFSASFGRLKDNKSWRFHGGTSLNEGFSFGGSFVLDPDPRYACTPFGYLNTEDGIKSYQKLWQHAMSYYPTLKLFEMGTLVLQANYLHNKDSEGIQARTSARPFYLLGLHSELLRGIHLDGVYDRNGSDRGYDNILTGGLGIRYKSLDVSFEKREGEEPRFFLQMISNL